MLTFLHSSVSKFPSLATVGTWIADFLTWAAETKFPAGQCICLREILQSSLSVILEQWRKKEMKTIRPYFKYFLLGLKMCENRSREFLDTVGGLGGLFL